MSRKGKIARLPHELREQLNHRLADGEPGPSLVQWLNGVPEVQRVLAAGFEGRPISEQNLSEWRTGGYREWQRQQERREQVRQLTEHATELEADTAGLGLGEGLAALLAAELAQSAQALLAEADEPAERWGRLQELLGELARLRRGDHHAARLRLQRERWDRELASDRARRQASSLHGAAGALFERAKLNLLFGEANAFSQALGLDQAERLLKDAAGAPPSSPPAGGNSN